MRIRALCLALVLSTGCDQGDPAPAPSAAPATAPATPVSPMLRGTMRGASATVTRCGTGDSVAISDPRNMLASIPAQWRSDTTQIFVLLAIDSAAQPPALASVQFASRERRDCFLTWDQFDVRAQGNEPGWVIEIKGTHGKLQRQGGTTFEWDNIESQHSATMSSYKGSGTAGSFELTIDNQGCRDSMADSYYGATARIKIGAEALSGCALRNLR